MKFISALITTHRNRIWFVLAGSVIAVLIFMYVLSFGSTVREVKWTPVLVDNFVIYIIESGEIRAVNSYNVQAPMEWRMELQITDMVKEGTHVNKGDFLAQFDTSTLEDELDTAIDQLKAQEAELLSIQTKQKSQMARFDSDLEMAKYSREMSKLQLELLKFESEIRKEDSRLAYQKALISFDETETRIKNQIIINEAEMRRVQQTLKHRQNNVEDLKKRIKQLTLRAPISGMVVYNEIGGWRGTPKHKVSIGETVWPRMTVIKIPDLSEIESIIKVNEIDAAKLTLGDRALLRLDAYEERVYSGRIVTIAPLADKADSEEESHIKNYEVVIRIDETDQFVKPGMSTKVRIILEEIPNSTHVPIGAVFEQNGEPVVFTRRNYPKPEAVKLGKRNDRYIIVEGDIKDSDEIAIAPPVPDTYPLGWFAEMQRKVSEKEVLLSHLDTMDKEGIVERIEEKSQKSPGEIPAQFKMIADLLEKAGFPLTEEQIEKLASFQPGPGSQRMMGELFTEEQRNALRSSGDRPGGRPGNP